MSELNNPGEMIQIKNRVPPRHPYPVSGSQGGTNQGLVKLNTATRLTLNNFKESEIEISQVFKSPMVKKQSHMKISKDKVDIKEEQNPKDIFKLKETLTLKKVFSYKVDNHRKHNNKLEEYLQFNNKLPYYEELIFIKEEVNFPSSLTTLNNNVIKSANNARYKSIENSPAGPTVSTGKFYYQLRLEINKFLFILRKFDFDLRFNSFGRNPLLFMPKRFRYLQPYASYTCLFRKLNKELVLKLKTKKVEPNLNSDLITTSATPKFNIIMWSPFDYRDKNKPLTQKEQERDQIILNLFINHIEDLLKQGKILLFKLNLLIITKKIAIINLITLENIKIEPAWLEYICKSKSNTTDINKINYKWVLELNQLDYSLAEGYRGISDLVNESLIKIDTTQAKNQLSEATLSNKEIEGKILNNKIFIPIKDKDILEFEVPNLAFLPFSLLYYNRGSVPAEGKTKAAGAAAGERAVAGEGSGEKFLGVDSKTETVTSSFKNKTDIINSNKNLNIKEQVTPIELDQLEKFYKNTGKYKKETSTIDCTNVNPGKEAYTLGEYDKVTYNNAVMFTYPPALSEPSSLSISIGAGPFGGEEILVEKPVLSHYLKEMSIYNMKNKGIIIFYYILIGFHFNTDLNKIYTSGKKNIYKLLAASFKSMYCLISKPVFISTPDKIIVQLFYYLFIPNVLKLKKFFKFNNSNKKTIRQQGIINNNRAIVKKSQVKLNKLRSKKKAINKLKPRKIQKDRFLRIKIIRKQYNKFRKIKINVRVKLRKLSNMSLVKVFPNKFKFLSLILNNIFKKTVVFDLVRIHYPYNDSNILVNLLGIMINKIKLRIIIRRFFEKAIIKNINNFKEKRGVLIPSFLSGLTIRVAGRLLTQKVVPRKTVKTTSRGASASGRINFKDIATYTNKNKRGAYSITVKAGQNLF